MSRISTVVILLIGIGAVAAGTFFLGFPRISRLQLEEATRGLETAGRLLQEMDRADEGRLKTALTEAAARKSLRDLLIQPVMDSASRKVWLDKLRSEVAGLTVAARGVAPIQDFFVLDNKGQGLVRNGDQAWTGKPPTEHAAMRAALEQAAQGQPQVLIYQENGLLLRGAVAPVMHGDRARGFLFATFPLDDALVQVRSSALKLDVDFAYLSPAGLSANNLSASSLEVCQQHLASDAAIGTRLLAGNLVEPQTIGPAGGELRLVGYPVVASGAEGLVGILVVRSISELNRPLMEIGLYLAGLAGLVLVFLSVVTLLFGGRLFRHLKELERQLRVSLQGEQARPIQVRGGPGVVRSLAGLINQQGERLGARGLEPEAAVGPADEKAGEDLPDERGPVAEEQPEADASAAGEDRPLGQDTPPEDGDEDEDLGTEEEEEAGAENGAEKAAPTSGDDSSADTDDPDGAYYRKLFEAFMRAKDKVGEKPTKLDFHRFRAKLEKQAAAIKDKHSCKAVLFEVRMKADKVSLVPKIVR